MVLESKKNLAEKKEKEKLPVDATPSSKQPLERFEQVFSEEMDKTSTKTTELEASSAHKDEIQRSILGACDFAALSHLQFSMTTERARKNIIDMECVAVCFSFSF